MSLMERGTLAAHMHDSGEFAVRSHAGQLTLPFQSLTGPIDARRVAEIGRAVTIWLPVFLLTLGQLSSAHGEPSSSRRWSRPCGS